MDKKFLLGLKDQSIYKSDIFQTWLRDIKGMNTYAFPHLPRKKFKEIMRTGLSSTAHGITIDDASQLVQKLYNKYLEKGGHNTPIEEILYLYVSTLAVSVFIVETGWAKSNNYDIFGFFGVVRDSDKFGRNYMDFVASQDFLDGSLYLAITGDEIKHKDSKTVEKKYMLCSRDPLVCVEYIAEYMMSKFFAYTSTHDLDQFNRASNTALYLKNGGEDKSEVDALSEYLNYRSRAILNFWYNGGHESDGLRVYIRTVFKIFRQLT